MDKPSKTSLNPVFLAIILLAGSCLSFSYLMEFWGGLEPCRLCLIQRYVYAVLLLISILGYGLKIKEFCHRTMMLLLCLGFLTSTYHSLVYFGLVTMKCSVSTDNVEDEESFMINLTRSPSCSKETPPILGIPLPIINAGIFLICLLYLTRGKLSCSSSHHFTECKGSTNGD